MINDNIILIISAKSVLSTKSLRLIIPKYISTSLYVCFWSYFCLLLSKSLYFIDHLGIQIVGQKKFFYFYKYILWFLGFFAVYFLSIRFIDNVKSQFLNRCYPFIFFFKIVKLFNKSLIIEDLTYKIPRSVKSQQIFWLYFIVGDLGHFFIFL